MTGILLHGCNGRLGSAVRALLDTEEYDAVVCAGVSADDVHAPFPIFKQISECDMPCDVIIDCSVAQAVPGVIEYANLHKIPLLVCTTGLSGETIDMLEDVSKNIAVFRSPNMSFGINLIRSLAEWAARLLQGYDVEIIEKHHNKKTDAPSGTAIMLADSIAKAEKEQLEYVFGRSPQNRGVRGKKEIGLHAVRGGNIVGDHTIIFAGSDEVIEITHSASSKNVFARGAIKAALFLQKQKPGIYGMDELFEQLAKQKENK